MSAFNDFTKEYGVSNQQTNISQNLKIPKTGSASNSFISQYAPNVAATASLSNVLPTQPFAVKANNFLNGITQSVKDYVPSFLGAAKEIVTHPSDAIAGVAEGALDFPTKIGNAVLNPFAKAIGTQAPTNNYLGTKLENYAETQNNLSQQSKDVRGVVNQGTQQYLGYEVGGKALDGIETVSTLGKIAKTTAGNVLGGQLTIDPNATIAERAKQALFDGAFGAVTEGAGSVAGKVFGKAVPKVVSDVLGKDATEIPHENPFVAAETPEPPKVINQTKDLGTDLEGNKVLSQHMQDPKTGNAIVYNDPVLTDPVQKAALQKQLGLPTDVAPIDHVNDIQTGKTMEGQIQKDPTTSISDVKSTAEELVNPGNPEASAAIKSEKAQRTAKLSSDIATDLKEDLGELPQYDTMNMQDQADKAIKLLREDPQHFQDVLDGKRKAPDGLYEGSVFRTARKIAKDTNNTQMLRDLAHSPLATEASELGKQVKAFDSMEKITKDPVKMIQKVEESRADAFKRKTGKTVKAAVRDGIDDVKKEIRKKATKQSWAEFIEDIKCK